MKILFVHETYGTLAGAEQNIRLTGEALKEKGHDLSFLYSVNNHRDESIYHAIFTAYHLPFDHTASTEREQRIKDLLTTIQPDIIYVHKNTDQFLLQVLMETKKTMVRMTHDHDTYCMRSYRYNYFTRKPCRRKAGWYCVFPCLAGITRNRNGRLPLKFNRLSHKLSEIKLNQRFDRIFVVTYYMKNEFITQGFNPENILIFPPIPKPQTTSFISSFSDKNILIYAGQLIRGKGVDCLIRAVARLKLPYQLLIIGTGSHESACRKLVSTLNLNDKVKFLGWVKQENLIEYYREATLVVVPSVWPEPIATIGLEVGRYGLPVVAFDAGGISDWLHDGQNGFLIPWKNIPAMGHAIQTLICDKTLAKKMGQTARELVNRDFDFKSYIDRMEQTFLSLVRIDMLNEK